MTIRRSRMSAGMLRANRASKRVGAGDRVRRSPRLHRGRRSPLPRLEPVRPPRPAGAAPVRGGGGPADRGAGRRQRVDERRQPAQAGSRAADRRGAGVRRARQPGSRGADRRSATSRRPCCRPRAARARSCRSCASWAACRANGRVGLAAAVRGFLARRRRRRRGLAIVISDFYDPAGHRAALDLLRHHRLEIVAIQVSAPQELAPDVCTATSSCATSRPARRAS